MTLSQKLLKNIYHNLVFLIKHSNHKKIEYYIQRTFRAKVLIKKPKSTT